MKDVVMVLLKGETGELDLDLKILLGDVGLDPEVSFVYTGEDKVSLAFRGAPGVSKSSPSPTSCISLRSKSN